MYIKLSNKKLEILECNTFKTRFKSFKFYLEKMEYGLYFPKRKIANTYFFCQRVDIIFTDKDYKIIGIKNNIRSEKLIINFKAKHLFILPCGYGKELKLGNVITIKK